MKSLLKIGLLFSLIGVCSWFCFFFCTSEVMAEGIPYSTYGANGIYFYNPCWMQSGNINSNFSANCHVDELTVDDLNGVEAHERLRMIVEHYGEFAMLLQKYYGVPWEMPFAIMVFESGVGTGEGVAGHVWEEAKLLNWAGLTLGGPSTSSDHYAHEGYYYLTCPGGQCNHFGGYDTISDMLLGIVVAHMRNGHNGDAGYDGGLKMLEPNNYRLDEAVDPLMSGYCVPAPGYPCYNDRIVAMMRGTSEWPEIADVTKQKGWMTSEELAKAWKIKPGGIATEKFGWGNIKEQAWEEWGKSGVPCSDEGGKKGSKKEEKDAEKKDEEETDTEKSNDEEESSSSDTEDSSNNGGAKAASSDTKLHKPTNEWLDKAGLEGFTIDKALNSRAGGKHIDTSAMTIGTDNYTSFASAAGDGAGLPGFIVLHWTAANTSGVSWTYFCGGDKDYYCPPHFAIDVVTKEIQQYFPLSSPSAAVAGSSENTWDQYGIQIEVVGGPHDADDYGHNRPEYNIYNFTDEQYEYLAKLLIAISDETGIPLESSLTWTKGDDGNIAPKLSAAETKKYIGVLGHEHLPDQSGKWDPGEMWEYLVPALERLGYKYNANGGSGGGKLVCAGDKNTNSCGGARIAEVARKLAWPDDNHHNDIKPEYAKAATEVGIASAATNWDGWAGGAADCGRFVAVVVRKAADPDYPACCTGPLQQYMSTSSSWEEIPNNNSEDNMKPGDVMVVNAGSGEGANGHIYIYLGNGEQASASLNGYTGKIKQGVTYTDSRGSYHIFRYVGNSNCGGDDGGATIGSFDEDLKKLEKDGGEVGVAASAPGNKDKSKVKIGGSWNGGRAWSTIKVPLAIAAIQENANTGSVSDPYGGSCNHSLNSAVNAAITQSDNCAAWWLWVALGGDNSSAGSKVTEVIRAGGDSSTEVNGTRNGSYLTSGKTDWLLVNQAIFASNMSSISGSSSVLSEMKTHNATDGSHGLASNYSSMVKGGWGDSDGAATRQFGLIKLNNGKCSAVAIGTNKGSNFSMLDKIVKVLLNHEDDLPAGNCPGGL